MMFFWKLGEGKIADVRSLMMKLHQTTMDLDWLPVGDMVHLADQECGDEDRLPGKFLLIAAGEMVIAPHEVFFFTATPPGDESRPFGLAVYPGHFEGSSQVVPTHLGDWQWIGGLEVTASFGGTRRGA